MIKVMTIVGTRPEIIRLSIIIKLLDETCNHTLIHTGQNFDYELNEIFFKDLGIRKPNFFLESKGNKPMQVIADIIAKVDEKMEVIKPDAVLILGDTNSALSSIAAKRRKIPIFHMEAGNRCFDFNVPEEINRRIVDVISDINLTYSKIAREYLIKENFPANQIITTGSPLKEVVNAYSKQTGNSNILKKLKVKEKKFYLYSFHREENVDNQESLDEILDSIEYLSNRDNLPIIVSTHPRTKDKVQRLNNKDNILFHKPFGYFDYLKLQTSAKCVVSDSGTISEESSILKFPAVTIRNTNERPEAFEEGVLIMSGVKKERIIYAIDYIVERTKNIGRKVKLVADYDVDNVSEKVVSAILSYTPFIKNKVWGKSE